MRVNGLCRVLKRVRSKVFPVLHNRLVLEKLDRAGVIHTQRLEA